MSTAIVAGLATAAAAALLFSSAVRRRAASPRASSAAASALTGILYRFKAPHWHAPLQAFESPIHHEHKRYCIYIGGLTDGLLACRYVDDLAPALDRLGWALVQPVLSSSYTGYGCSSLARDAEELGELLATIDARGPVDAFALVGHSTGCQDIVTLLRSAPPSVRAKVRAAVLQAPVSDREADSIEADPAEAARLAKVANALIDAGKGHELMPGYLHNGFVPISAARYASLHDRMTADDMFSSDLSDAELARCLGHMGTRGQREGVVDNDGGWLVEPLPSHPGLRTCFACSGADEYVPKHVDTRALAQRFVTAAGSAANGAEAYIVPAANHNCATPPSAAEDFVRCVCRVLGKATA